MWRPAIDVVILAGGKCNDALREATGVELRADIPFGDRTMLDIVIEAVSSIGSPIVVGGNEGHHQNWSPAGSNFVESVAIGLNRVTTENYLLATVDLPFLTPEAVDDFVSRCDTSAGLCYPIVDIEECMSQFPGMSRTVLKMREGTFTGGNLGLVKTEAMKKALPILEKAYAVRKSPLQLANMVGFATLGRVAVGKVVPSLLTLAKLEEGVSRFLGMPVKAVKTAYASIGTDIDTAEQYSAAVDLLKLQKSPIS